MPKDPKQGDEKKRRGLFGGLFKKAPEAEEDDFRPATSFVPRSAPVGGQQDGARAPSREAVVAVAKTSAPTGAAFQQHRAKPAAQRPDPENKMMVKNNKLYELYCQMSGETPSAIPGAVFDLSLFMPLEEQPDREQRTWLKGIERDVRSMPQYAIYKPAANSQVDTPAIPVDAYAFVRVSSDGLAAYLFILPPLNGGQPIPSEWVYRLLEEQQVNTGVDQSAIATVCSGHYMMLTKIASGLAPQNGEDGDVIDRFARGMKIELTVLDDGTIDFKDLGWLQTAEEGEVICEVIAPTPGVPGITVKGATLAARDGRYRAAPMGPGTRMSDDGAFLLAGIHGVVSFINDRFRVDPLLIVQGDIDNAIGNLDVMGDLLVYGDVREGFTVKATGNITVQGMVEAAHVECGKNIRLGRGINGNSTGTLIAGGEVTCQFIENANVKAKGPIISETVVNSSITSDAFISVKTGRGAIIGGSAAAVQYVEAVTIGNESNRLIEVILGNTAEFLEEVEAMETRCQNLTEEISDKEKNIQYLAAMEEALSYKDASSLAELRQGLPAQKTQLMTLRRRLEILKMKAQDYSECYLKARVIHPPLELTIGDIAAELRQVLKDCQVFREDDAIQVEELSIHDFK